MKKILCFGDSNTFGFIPATGKRYDKKTRWTGILQELAGCDYEVIEAGCNNRTGFSDNPSGKMFTGYKILPDYLSQDMNFVILQIGLNDLQFQYDFSVEKFETGLEKLLDIVNDKSEHAKVILIAPSLIGENIHKSYFSTMFDEISVEKSKKLPQIYKDVAKKRECLFIDLNQIATVSDIDGLHYEASEHKKIAEAIYPLILNP